jgi:ADP-ribosylglycohydrolase
MALIFFKEMDMKSIERISGGLFGLVVGDALGVPVEFGTRAELKRNPVVGMRGNGTHNQRAGTWSDDSSMTLCLAASLAENGYDLKDQAGRFLRWYRDAYMTPYGEVFDIGNATRQALEQFEQGAEPVMAGGRTDLDNGNGSLMRILPAAFYFAGEAEKDLYARIKEMSSVTHGHWKSVLSCCIYVFVARNLYRGLSKKDALMSAAASVSRLFADGASEDVPSDGLGLFSAVLDGTLASRPEMDIRSGGYVIDTLSAALWCFYTTQTYPECVLKAVNLGEDTDTTAAVAGALAGTYYGKIAIPSEWTEKLAGSDYLTELIDGFAQVCLKRDAPGVPFPNSYWIEPGRLLAGEYPRDLDDGSSRRKLSALLDTEPTCIIDLTCAGDRSEYGELKPYRQIIASLEKERNVQKPCTIIRMGIRDYSIPEPSFMERILDTIDAHLDTGGLVYFHCWGGHGRTGTVAGCWLKRHGKAKGDAVFKLITDLRQHMKDAHKASPETEEQNNFVRNWKE